MRIWNLKDTIKFSPLEQTRMVLEETPKYKVAVVGLEPGQKLDPCRMESATVFQVLEGQGVIIADGEVGRLEPGSLIIMDPNVERSVTANSRMILVTIQIHDSYAAF